MDRYCADAFRRELSNICNDQEERDVRRAAKQLRNFIKERKKLDLPQPNPAWKDATMLRIFRHFALVPAMLLDAEDEPEEENEDDEKKRLVRRHREVLACSRDAQAEMQQVIHLQVGNLTTLERRNTSRKPRFLTYHFARTVLPCGCHLQTWLTENARFSVVTWTIFSGWKCQRENLLMPRVTYRSWLA